MHDIAEFLREHEPFGDLDDPTLSRLAANAEVEFFTAGTTIFQQGEDPQTKVRMVRRGAVELVDRGRVLDVLAEGELFGHPSMLSGLPTGFEARAREDSLCYALPALDVMPLLARPSSLGFVARSLLRRRRPGAAPEPELGSAEVAGQPATKLIRRPPLVCEPDLLLRDAARRMVKNGDSSVVIQLANGDLGIVTDHDLRERVVARGLPADARLEQVMTTPVVTVRADDTGADVMVAMLDNDIRHIPVLSPTGEVLGVIVGIDLVAAESQTPFLLRRAVSEANDAEELRQVARRLQSTVAGLHRAHLGPAQISEVISIVTDALIRRLIDFATASEGPPPAEFAWLALGSQGRREPMLSSDLDSGMSWRDYSESGPEPRRLQAGEATREFMRALASDVADTLRVIGWGLDPHGVNAGDIFSTSSIGEWRNSIRDWLQEPSDERVLVATSILLDGRTVEGPEDLNPRRVLFESEHREALDRWMLRQALAQKPPTGFLRDIVVADSGEHRGSFDIKHGGLLPVVNLARYASFKGRADVLRTVQRLHAAVDAGTLERSNAETLEEAYELFTTLRMEHQVGQVDRGEPPSNHIDPKLLNPLTRRYLRDAFREVAAMQRALGRKQ